MYVTGIDPSKVRSSTEGPEFKLGTLGAVVNQSTMYTAPMSDTGTTAGSDVGPKIFMYVKSVAGVTGDGYVCVVDPSTYTAKMVDTTESTPGTQDNYPIGVARGAIAANGYGWVQVYGQSAIRALASTAKATPLNTTGTSGALDASAAVGSEVVNGAVLTTATGGAAGSAAGFLNWPHLGRTL